MAKTLITLLCIVMTVGPVKSSISRFWADKEVVKPGETIVLTCEFKSYDTHDTVHFYKIHPDNKTTVLTTAYALDDSLAEQTNRFNFTYKDPVGGNAILTQTLSIMNAVPGDSGNYSCYLKDVDMNNMVYRAYLNITVQVEPQTIMLYLDDVEIYNGSNSVSLKFLQARKLRCETTRSNPGANITITTGNGKHVHFTSVVVGNATYQFDERDTTNQFVVPVYRNTTALADSWFLDTDDVGKPVVCWAKVDRDAPGIMTSFLPAVADGPPQIKCNDTFYAQNGQRNFVINCSSFAKPSITRAMFYYVKDKMNYTIQGFPVNREHASSDGKVRGIVQMKDDTVSSLRLTIDSVDLNANIIYNFYVANDYGQVVHDAEIKDIKASLSTAVSTCLNAFLFVCLVGFGILGQL